jgi:hypothetical protein
MVRTGSNTIRETVYVDAVYGATAWIIHGNSPLETEASFKEVISESYPGGWMLTLHLRFHRVKRAIFSNSFRLISSTEDRPEFI